MNRLTVAWFSAGVSSAVATWIARDQIDKIIYTHIDDQECDTLRFVKDCEKWFGKPIEILQSPYKNVESAWKASGARIPNWPGVFAPCTNLLKRRVRMQWECDNLWFNNIRYVWGMDVLETKPRKGGSASRVEGIINSMPDFEHMFPLAENNITKEEAHAILSNAGVKRPRMYDLGYRNNNCVGCVKGGKGYWNKIRIDFPELFAKRAKLEREIGGSCLNGTYLDELDPDAGRDEGPVVESCGIFCELMMSKEAANV
jgi:hypothetical protein